MISRGIDSYVRRSEMRKIVKCERCGHEQLEIEHDDDPVFDLGNPDSRGYGRSNPNYGKPLFWREDRIDDFPKGGYAEYGGI